MNHFNLTPKPIFSASEKPLLILQTEHILDGDGFDEYLRREGYPQTHESTTRKLIEIEGRGTATPEELSVIAGNSGSMLHFLVDTKTEEAIGNSQHIFNICTPEDIKEIRFLFRHRLTPSREDWDAYSGRKMPIIVPTDFRLSTDVDGFWGYVGIQGGNLEINVGLHQKRIAIIYSRGRFYYVCGWNFTETTQ